MTGATKRDAKSGQVLVDLAYLTKILRLVEKHEKILADLAEKRAENLGFELHFIDEDGMLTADLFVLKQSFSNEIKALFAKYKVRHFSGAFDLVNTAHENQDLKKVVEGRR